MGVGLGLGGGAWRRTAGGDPPVPVPQRLALLAAFAALLVGRVAGAWAHGRFIDEEATVFLAYAWHRPWADALWRPFGGYLNIVANAVTLLDAKAVRRGWLTLTAAPYLTMTVATAIQLVPAAVILSGRAAWLRTRGAAVASLLVVVLMPATEEVYANVLHSQFHLALACALILALDVPAARATRIGYGAVLFVAPLCGPGAIVMLPLLGLRGVVERDPRRLAQAATLGAGAAIQLALFYGANPMRGHAFDAGTLLAALSVRLVALPVLGFRVAYGIGHATFDSRQAGGPLWAVVAGIGTAAIAGLCVATRRSRSGGGWLIAAALLVAFVSFGYGMVILHPFDLFSAGAGERYNYLPTVLLGLAVLALVGRRTRWPGPALPAVILGVMFVRDYLHPLPVYAAGPDWSAEVARWRGDHDHAPMVWPSPWRADLSDRGVACPPLTPRGTSGAPRYCEAGWVADFWHVPPP